MQNRLCNKCCNTWYKKLLAEKQPQMFKTTSSSLYLLGTGKNTDVYSW